MKWPTRRHRVCRRRGALKRQELKKSISDMGESKAAPLDTMRCVLEHPGTFLICGGPAVDRTWLWPTEAWTLRQILRVLGAATWGLHGMSHTGSTGLGFRDDCVEILSFLGSFTSTFCTGRAPAIREYCGHVSLCLVCDKVWVGVGVKLHPHECQGLGFPEEHAVANRCSEPASSASPGHTNVPDCHVCLPCSQMTVLLEITPQPHSAC